MIPVPYPATHTIHNFNFLNREIFGLDFHLYGDFGLSATTYAAFTGVTSAVVLETFTETGIGITNVTGGDAA